jgi:hypothetical protein
MSDIRGRGVSPNVKHQQQYEETDENPDDTNNGEGNFSFRE